LWNINKLTGNLQAPDYGVQINTRKLTINQQITTLQMKIHHSWQWMNTRLVD